MIDNLVRHKWPEEKPKADKEYLTLSATGFWIYSYERGEWLTYVDITHWWELPEVTE